MLFPLYNYYLESPLSLDEVIEDFINSFYLKKHGSNKVDKLIRVITNSTSIASIDAFSIQRRVVPNYVDFASAINSVPWLLFQSNETQALGVLIAAREWASRVNRVYHFGDEWEVRDKALKIFEKYSIYKEMTKERYDSMRTGQESSCRAKVSSGNMEQKYNVLVREILSSYPSFRILRSNPGFIAIGHSNFMASIEITIQEISSTTIIHIDTEDKVRHKREEMKWEFPSSMDQNEMIERMADDNN